MRTHALRAATVLVLLGALAGCGQVGLLNGTTDAQERDLQTWRTNGPGGMGLHEGMGRPGEGLLGFGWLQDLDLSDAQREDLQAIADTYRPEMPDSPAGQPPFSVVRRLLSAEPLDVEALRTALAEAAPSPKAPPVWPAEAFVKLRDLLTAAQRAELVSRLKAMPLPSGDRPEPPAPAARFERLAGQLKLSDEQSALLQAFTEKLPAPPQPKGDSVAHRDAWITLLETGDASGIEALEPARGDLLAFPVDEFVALAQALSVEQRQALLAPAQGAHGPERPVGFMGGHPGRPLGEPGGGMFFGPFPRH
ncbi:hypothetical protein D3C87_1275790 [compost metagenome]